MLSRVRLPAVLLIIALFLIAIGYLNIRPESFMQDPPAATAEETPIDFYLINARTVQYQPDGKLNYEMTSEKVEHLKATDVSLLTRPDLRSYRGSDLPWHVTSDRGEVGPQGEEVELIDNVRVERTDTKGRQTVVTTSRMTVLPDKEYAETSQPVRIVAANGVTTATGMKAYLNEGRMLLLSNVRGQHELR